MSAPTPGKAGKGAASRGSRKCTPCQKYNDDGSVHEDFETHGFFAGIDPKFYSEPIRSLQAPLVELERTRFGRTFIKNHLHPILCLNPTDYPGFDADLPSFFDNHPIIAKATERKVCGIIDAIDDIDTRLSNERKKRLSEYTRADSWEDLAIDRVYNGCDLAVGSFSSWAETLHPPFGDDNDLGECGPALIAFLAHIFPTVEVGRQIAAILKQHPEPATYCRALFNYERRALEGYNRRFLLIPFLRAYDGGGTDENHGHFAVKKPDEFWLNFGLPRAFKSLFIAHGILRYIPDVLLYTPMVGPDVRDAPYRLSLELVQQLDVKSVCFLLNEGQFNGLTNTELCKLFKRIVYHHFRIGEKAAQWTPDEHRVIAKAIGRFLFRVHNDCGSFNLVDQSRFNDFVRDEIIYGTVSSFNPVSFERLKCAFAMSTAETLREHIEAKDHHRLLPVVETLKARYPALFHSRTVLYLLFDPLHRIGNKRQNRFVYDIIRDIVGLFGARAIVQCQLSFVVSSEIPPREHSTDIANTIGLRLLKTRPELTREAPFMRDVIYAAAGKLYDYANDINWLMLLESDANLSTVVGTEMVWPKIVRMAQHITDPKAIEFVLQIVFTYILEDHGKFHAIRYNPSALTIDAEDRPGSEFLLTRPEHLPPISQAVLVDLPAPVGVTRRSIDDKFKVLSGIRVPHQDVATLVWPTVLGPHNSVFRCRVADALHEPGVNALLRPTHFAPHESRWFLQEIDMPLNSVVSIMDNFYDDYNDLIDYLMEKMGGELTVEPVEGPNSHAVPRCAKICATSNLDLLNNVVFERYGQTIFDIIFPARAVVFDNDENEIPWLVFWFAFGDIFVNWSFYPLSKIASEGDNYCTIRKFASFGVLPDTSDDEMSENPIWGTHVYLADVSPARIFIDKDSRLAEISQEDIDRRAPESCVCLYNPRSGLGSRALFVLSLHVRRRLQTLIEANYAEFRIFEITLSSLLRKSFNARLRCYKKNPNINREDVDYATEFVPNPALNYTFLERDLDFGCIMISPYGVHGHNKVLVTRHIPKPVVDGEGAAAPDAAASPPTNLRTRARELEAAKEAKVASIKAKDDRRIAAEKRAAAISEVEQIKREYTETVEAMRSDMDLSGICSGARDIVRSEIERVRVEAMEKLVAVVEPARGEGGAATPPESVRGGAGARKRAAAASRAAPKDKRPRVDDSPPAQDNSGAGGVVMTDLSPFRTLGESLRAGIDKLAQPRCPILGLPTIELADLYIGFSKMVTQGMDAAIHKFDLCSHAYTIWGKEVDTSNPYRNPPRSTTDILRKSKQAKPKHLPPGVLRPDRVIPTRHFHPRGAPSRRAASPHYNFNAPIFDPPDYSSDESDIMDSIEFVGARKERKARAERKKKLVSGAKAVRKELKAVERGEEGARMELASIMMREEEGVELGLESVSGSGGLGGAAPKSAALMTEVQREIASVQIELQELEVATRNIETARRELAAVLEVQASAGGGLGGAAPGSAAAAAGPAPPLPDSDWGSDSSSISSMDIESCHGSSADEEEDDEAVMDGARVINKLDVEEGAFVGFSYEQWTKPLEYRHQILSMREWIADDVSKAANIEISTHALYSHGYGGKVEKALAKIAIEKPDHMHALYIEVLHKMLRTTKAMPKVSISVPPLWFDVPYAPVFMDTKNVQLFVLSPIPPLTDKEGVFMPSLQGSCGDAVEELARRIEKFHAEHGASKKTPPKDATINKKYEITLQCGLIVFGFQYKRLPDPANNKPAHIKMWIKPNPAVVSSHYVFGRFFATAKPFDPEQQRFFAPDFRDIAKDRYGNRDVGHRTNLGK